MKSFPVHTIASAPENSRASLEALQGAFGSIPNMAGAMATSPVLIESLVGLFGRVHGGSFAETRFRSFYSLMRSLIRAGGQSHSTAHLLCRRALLLQMLTPFEPDIFRTIQSSQHCRSWRAQ